MDKDTSSSSQRPAPVSSREFADTLGDVMREEERKKAASQDPRGPGKRRSSPMAWLALVVLSGVSLYLWFGSPSFLQPAPPRPLSPRLVEAGLRVEVALQAMRVDEFRAQEGRLPSSLAEAGNPFTTVVYQRNDGQGYRLSAGQEGIHVEFASGESLQTFLGNARQIILEGGR